jgi:hypothetical protein
MRTVPADGIRELLAALIAEMIDRLKQAAFSRALD